MGTHGYPSYKTWSQNWPKLGMPHIRTILNIFSKHSFFWIQWVPMGTHHPIAMKMKICLLIGCLGPSFITCIFLSNQQEKSLFSDSADPSIFSDKMAVTSVLLYILLLQPFVKACVFHAHPAILYLATKTKIGTLQKKSLKKIS